MLSPAPCVGLSFFRTNGNKPSFFTTGFIAGATETINDLNSGSLSGQQLKFLTKGDQFREFILKQRNAIP